MTTSSERALLTITDSAEFAAVWAVLELYVERCRKTKDLEGNPAAESVQPVIDRMQRLVHRMGGRG